MSWLSKLFGRTKIVIKLPHDLQIIADAAKIILEAKEAGQAMPLLASPDQVDTAVDDFENATKQIVLTGMDVALLRLGPFALFFGPAIKTLVIDVLGRVFNDIEKKFIEKHGIQAPVPA